MQPNCLHDNSALTQSGHAAGWGSHGPTQRSPSNCTCPGSYLPQRLGGQYCSQNFQAASASRGNIRAGCDVPIRRVVIEKYRLFATCRYREPSGRARFPAHWKSAVRKRGSIERFVENQRPSIRPCGLVRVPAGSCGKIRTPAGSGWGGTLRQTYVTQRFTTAANSCGKVRNPAPTAINPTSSAPAGSPTERIRQNASSIPVCGIEPASSDQSDDHSRSSSWVAAQKSSNSASLASLVVGYVLGPNRSPIL